MNFDQRSNIDSEINALLGTIARAWRCYRMLNGLHSGSKAMPGALRNYPELLNEIWRVSYESMHLAIASLVDRHPQANSLNALIKKLRKYNPGDARIGALCRDAESQLADAAVSGIAKSEFWRNSAIAHNTLGGRDSGLYEEHKTSLEEVRGALEHLEVVLAVIVVNLDRVVNDTRHQAKVLEAHAIELVKRLSQNV